MKLLLNTIFLLGLFWNLYSEKETYTSINKNSPEVLKLKNDSVLKFDLIKTGKRILYSGGEKLNNENTKTCGIYIQKVSDNQIEYEYTQLINWKLEYEQNGKAHLISTTDSIFTTNKKEVSYKFIDNENELVIFVTKNNRINITKSKVFFKNEEKNSALMYYK